MFPRMTPHAKIGGETGETVENADIWHFYGSDPDAVWVHDPKLTTDGKNN